MTQEDVFDLTVDATHCFFANGILVHNCHHASARSYRRILEYLSPSPLILGVTATPARADGKQLGDVWQEIVYQRGIAEMIRAGYLADIRGVRVGLEQVKLDEVEQSGGDFDANALGEVLEQASAPLHVLTAYRQHATGRKAIVFVPTVALAHRMATVFREAGIRAEALDGKTQRDERQGILERLHSGETRVVTNVGVLSEGVDVPSVDAIVMASPTRSQVKYCLDAKSEALTPAGFRKGAELKVGDLVASYDRRIREVRWEPITAHIARPFDPVRERMFALQSGTIDLRVTGDHRMVWTDRRSKRARVTSAAELAERRDEWRLPVAGYQEAPGVALSDDELRFIGWWLTDGTTNRANGTVIITQSHRYQEHVAAIDACLAGCRLQHRRHEQAERGDEGFRTHYGQTKWVIQRTSLGAMAGWRGHEEFAPWLDKDLSPALEDVTRDQLAVLLHALHLGDGDKHDRLQSWTQRTYCIGTARRLLADRLQSLCVRRGMRCNMSTDPRPERTQTYWHIHVRVDRDYRTVTGRTTAAREPGRPTLQETGGRAGEVVWCITVPSGAFITRRNNKTAVVGNSQAVGRGLRTFPGKEDCLVIDVVGASERLDLQTLPRLFNLRDVPAPEVTVTEALERARLEKAEIDRRRALERQRADERAAAAGRDTPDGELRSRPVSMLAARRRTARRLRWIRHRECWLVSLGSTGTLALVPDGSRWRVLRLQGGKHEQLASGVDVGYAHGIAEDYVRAAGAQALAAPYARWRSNPMNGAQATLLRRLGITAPEGTTKGEASDLITVAKAAQLLDRLADQAA